MFLNIVLERQAQLGIDEEVKADVAAIVTTSPDTVEKEAPTFDGVFNYVNSFGWYQRGLYLGVNLLITPISLQFALLVFAMGTPKFHCDLANSTCPPNKCCDNCTSYTFDGPFTSSVSEWNLICDRAYLGATITSCFFGGMLVGSIVGGWASDRFGRRFCLLYGTLFMALFSLGTFFANSPALLASLRFGVGFTLAAIMLCQYVYVIEIVGSKTRTMSGKVQDFFWDIGDIASFTSAFLIREWRWLILCCTLTIVPFLLFWRFAISLVSFGIYLYVTALAGNLYVNYLVMTLLSIPHLPISWFLMQKYGRRIPFCGYLLLNGILCLTVMSIPKEHKLVITGLAIFGKSLSSCAFNNIYLLSSEQFPTVLRNVGLGTGSMCARVGAMLSPFFVMLAQLPGFSLTLPLSIFGVFALLAALASLWLPETFRSSLPQTVEELEETKEHYGIPCFSFRYRVQSEVVVEETRF